jgi:hypothetical protein
VARGGNPGTGAVVDLLGVEQARWHDGVDLRPWEVVTLRIDEE